jgi:phosphatidylglycerol---prolipoprotein diacylglyceryl transferase
VILAAPIRFGIDPLAWEILPRIRFGALAVSPHGLGIAIGFLIGAQLMIRRSKASGGPSDTDIWNTLFWSLIGAMAGARIAYVIGHFSQVTDSGNDLLGIFKVWEGGISLLGGITGGILAGLPYARRHRLGFWRMLDVAAPGLALGIAVGRIGDLMIGDHLGKPTEFFLGWRCLGETGGVQPQSAAAYQAAVDAGAPPSLGCYDVVLHQTAIYDFLSSWVLFAVLIWLGRKSLKPGLLTIVFGIWYGAMRVITDFLRVDKTYFGLTGSQIMALAVVLVCLYFLLRYRGAPPRYALPPPTPTDISNTESSQESENSVNTPSPERGA